MELDFDAPLSARQVAHGATAQALDKISTVSAGLELANCLGRRILTLAGVMRLFLDGAKHEAGNAGVFDGWVGGHTLRGRQLMELFDSLAIAVSIAPPAAPRIDAIALHALE